MEAVLKRGPADGHLVDVPEPPEPDYDWYSVETGETHRYRLSNYDPDPGGPAPRAVYSHLQRQP